MKGLSFSEPMMRAWLEGRKTVTRRMMNPRPLDVQQDRRPDKFGRLLIMLNPWTVAEIKPRYTPGETVYIKEWWRVEGFYDMDREAVLEYKDGIQRRIVPPRWWIAKQQWPGAYPFSGRSPMFMPQWASRSHAVIEDVRAERIQEITEEEAIAEGLSHDPCGWYVPGNAHTGAVVARESFAQLWETLHPGSWSRNDWVWRYGLERIKEVA